MTLERSRQRAQIRISSCRCRGMYYCMCSRSKMCEAEASGRRRAANLETASASAHPDLKSGKSFDSRPHFLPQASSSLPLFFPPPHLCAPSPLREDLSSRLAQEQRIQVLPPRDKRQVELALDPGFCVSFFCCSSPSSYRTTPPLGLVSEKKPSRWSSKSYTTRLLIFFFSYDSSVSACLLDHATMESVTDRSRFLTASPSRRFVFRPALAWEGSTSSGLFFAAAPTAPTNNE